MHAKTLRFVGAATAALVILNGCGGAAPTAAPAGQQTPAPQGRSRGQGQNGQGQNGQRPSGQGARSLIADVSGSTMQVQGDNQQTAVTWSPTTTITRTVPASAQDVRVGTCISARGADGATGTTWEAAAVTLTNDSACADRPSRTPNPGRTPNGTRTPGNGGQGGQSGGFAVGKVTSVNGGTIVVAPLNWGRQGTNGDVTITTSPSTAYTKEAAGTAKDIVVGQCAQAAGKPDASGMIAATSIALSAPVNGACQGGMRGRRG